MPGIGENDSDLFTFDSLLNDAPFGVYLVDEDLRIRQVNAAAVEMFLGMSDLIGRDFDEVSHLIWPKASADEIVERFRQTLATGVSFILPEKVEDRAAEASNGFHDGQIDR